MRIELFAEPEDMTPEQAEESNNFCKGFADSVRIIEQEADGCWGWCVVVIRVTTPDGVGEDSLGGCSYRSAFDFIQNSGYFCDMIKNALSEIKK